MTTRDAQACLSVELLSQLSSDELEPARLREIEEHVGHCERCRQLLEDSQADPEWCLEIAPILRSHTESPQITAHYDGGGPEQETLESILRLLGPTDDPHMLGRIGPYEVVSIIGRGGMGVVFKAFDSALNRFVAIKMLLQHLAASGAARKRFAREGQAAAAVIDDNVLPIYSVAEWQGVPYLVTQYSRGTTLQKRIQDQGPLELKEILRIGMQTARGLAAAHAQGLVHRDVKPSNILLDGTVERALLTDFGLARAADDASLTRTGVIAGTPQYMSPEQARGGSLDARSDLFGLGCVLYEMCTGRPPFRADNSYTVLRMIADDEPRSIREINPDIPEWLCRVVSRLMAKSPEARFESALEVATLLEQCLAHVQQPSSVVLPAPLAPSFGGRSWIFSRTPRGLVTLLGALGFLFLGMLLWQATNAPDIAGNWTSPEWGTIVLQAGKPGRIEGTYTGSQEVSPGRIKLEWSRSERRFNGTWVSNVDPVEESRDPPAETAGASTGTLSLRLVQQEIRGKWTTEKEVQREAGTPRLTNLVWARQAEPTEGARVPPSKTPGTKVIDPTLPNQPLMARQPGQGKRATQEGATALPDKPALEFEFGHPQRVLSVSEVLQEGKALNESKELVVVRFQVAESHKFASPAAGKENWLVLSSERAPYDSHPLAFRVFLTATAWDDMKKKGVDNIVQTFVGKIIDVEGRIQRTEATWHPGDATKYPFYSMQIERLEQVVRIADVPPSTKADPLLADRNNVRSVIGVYVAAALSGQKEIATSLAVAGEKAAAPQLIDAMARSLTVQQLALRSIHLDDCAQPTRALGISEPVQHAVKQRNGEQTGVVVFELIRQATGWLIQDLQFQSLAGANQELEQFQKAHPRSIDLPPLTPNTLPDGTDSDWDQSRIRWGVAVSGLRLGARFDGNQDEKVRRFHHGERVVLQLFLQNISADKTECGFDPVEAIHGQNALIAKPQPSKTEGVLVIRQQEGKVIPPEPLQRSNGSRVAYIPAPLSGNYTTLMPGEILQLDTQAAAYAREDHPIRLQDLISFDIVARSPARPGSEQPRDYVLPAGNYTATIALQVFQSGKQIVLECPPCAFEVLDRPADMPTSRSR